MASLIRMPQKGLSEDSAILSKWYVKEGDTVKKGDFVFAIETGKATFDVESEGTAPSSSASVRRGMRSP